MNQITGVQELRFLAQAGGDAARLAELARELSVLAEGADPTIAEWETCLLELHRVVAGPRIHAELTCPDCGAGVALIFGVDDLPREPGPVAGNVDGCPIRPLRLSDLVAVEAADGADRLCLLLARATGQPQGWASDHLHSETAAAALEQALSGLDLRLGTSCTECGAEIVQPFDVQDFVLAERTNAAKTLLDEVHMMAKSYHWSEPEILALPRSRRLEYLARIDRDALQIEVRDVGQ